MSAPHPMVLLPHDSHTAIGVPAHPGWGRADRGTKRGFTTQTLPVRRCAKAHLAVKLPLLALPLPMADVAVPGPTAVEFVVHVEDSGLELPPPVRRVRWADGVTDNEGDGDGEEEDRPLLEGDAGESHMFPRQEDGGKKKKKKDKAAKAAKKAAKAGKAKSKDGAAGEGEDTVASFRRLLREGKSEWRRLLAGSVCLFGAAGANLVVPSLFGNILDAMTRITDKTEAIRMAQYNCFLLLGKHPGGRIPCAGRAWRRLAATCLVAPIGPAVRSWVSLCCQGIPAARRPFLSAWGIIRLPRARRWPSRPLASRVCVLSLVERGSVARPPGLCAGRPASPRAPPPFYGLAI